MDYVSGMMMKGNFMIENTCDNCVKWFDCYLHNSKYDQNLGKYGNCEGFEADEVLEGRIAKCTDCGEKQSSKPSLPFFWYRPDKMHDSYYCGCRGWD